ncbi:MAG: hypothetical protein ABIS59_04390, partial [Candidatus Saccharibacteria bacterium]
YQVQEQLHRQEAPSRPPFVERAPIVVSSTVQVDAAIAAQDVVFKATGPSSRLGRPSKPGLTPAQIAAKKAKKSAASKAVDPKISNGQGGKKK